MTTQTSKPVGANEVELSILVPVFQEEKAIPMFLQRMEPALKDVTGDYEIVFCMDPGKDRTLDVISEAIEHDPRIRALVMTRRWGQNACMTAGIEECRGRACVIIDVDLQDPPELIKPMFQKWKEGFDVVYAERRTRQGDPIGRRVVAYCGYWLINKISDIKVPRNIGDFRLLDRKVMEGLRGLKETHGFLRGLVPYVGYKQTSVLFDREERKAGDSKYSRIIGSLKHGLDGIVAFSSKPLTIATVFGFVVAGLSCLLAFVYVIAKIVAGEKLLTGMSPILLSVTFLGGIQLLCLGIMGEYIGRIYEEVRQRPKYMIAQRINFPA